MEPGYFLVLSLNKRKQDWISPTNAAKRGNAAYIRRLVVRKSADEAAADNNRNNL